MVLVVKNPPANTGDMRDVGPIPASGRSPGGRHSNLLQYSCLENPMNRGAWQATVHRVAKSQTRLKSLSRHAYKVGRSKYSIFDIHMHFNTICFPINLTHIYSEFYSSEII